MAEETSLVARQVRLRQWAEQIRDCQNRPEGMDVSTWCARYADDVLIFTKSEMAANRVMNSISDWLERKLFLKVNATKTKVVRPTRSKYLGFTFLKNGGEWKVKPTTEKRKKLKKKLSEYLKRGKAVARPLVATIKRVNEIVRGWINYFRIGLMKQFMEDFG